MAFALLGVGGLILLVAAVFGIMLLVEAFKVHVLWGLGSIFVPFVSLIFVIMHWQVAKKPFLWNLLGAVLIVVPLIMNPELMAQMS